ncbi:hypothetical protein BCVP_CDS0015 [Bacillus phage BC-VP]|nr:hypothetical protein BCVP_CDS0015 [Bacillus phage BC-VP]
MNILQVYMYQGLTRTSNRIVLEDTVKLVSFKYVKNEEKMSYLNFNVFPI